MKEQWLRDGERERTQKNNKIQMALCEFVDKTHPGVTWFLVGLKALKEKRKERGQCRSMQ